jgi:hypothetical protein
MAASEPHRTIGKSASCFFLATNEPAAQKHGIFSEKRSNASNEEIIMETAIAITLVIIALIWAAYSLYRNLTGKGGCGGCGGGCGNLQDRTTCGSRSDEEDAGDASGED